MKNNHPGEQLWKMLQRGVVSMPGAYDSLSALLIQKAGFKAGYITGAGLSVSVLGKPDIGLLTLDEVVEVTHRITSVVDLPFLVDVDTGFGGINNVARTVQEMESAGAAAIQIEDQEFPKRCGHLSGKRVVPIEEMVQKIRMAVSSRKNRRFLIVARTDARSVEGIRAALRRAQAYKKAGADIIFPEALQSVGEFRWFGQQKGLGVLLANMTEFGRSPALSVKELTHLGYRLVLFPMTAFRAAAFAMEKSLAYLKQFGETQSLLPHLQPRRDLYSLIRYDEFDQREKKFLDATKRKTKRTK